MNRIQILEYKFKNWLPFRLRIALNSFEFCSQQAKTAKVQGVTTLHARRQYTIIDGNDFILPVSSMFGQLLLGMKNRPPHVRESGFWKEGNFRIWYIQNPENLSFGILIFGIRKTAQEEFGTPLTIRSGIQAPVTKNRESRTWNPEIYNLHS